MKCKLCSSENINDISGILDENLSFVEAYSCNVCGAISPYFPDASYTEEDQGNYHNDFFRIDIDSNIVEIKSGSINFSDWVEERLVVNSSNYHMLDLGCGRGNFSEAFKCKGYSVQACDISEELVKLAVEKFGLTNDEVENATVQDFLSRTEFSNDKEYLVLLFHVLEHMDNPLDVLSKLKNKIKKGKLIIELPLATPNNVFLCHNFFPTKKTAKYIAEFLEASLLRIDTIDDHGFIRFSYQFNSAGTCEFNHFPDIDENFNVTLLKILNEQMLKRANAERKSITGKEIDTLRDTSIDLFNQALNTSIELLEVASKARPEGAYIKEKLTRLKSIHF
ncbi:TPA: class I SAM-dependent methyltransferase [Vibrio parahaemolyticus]|uniref:class I SAM-dependent methyltransferase n=1 Tax=Vibrio parahaemolyticus TaxID=670 RepID=UPI00111EEED1|nr:class I SAM-dependent methyltransferase [Vibrio parahaemolyticus]TOQ50903.1 hypothetical protein CGG94_15145 [Vibrio parahaemolyticus]HCE2439735.1 class I SAM-dependent methyltransferase [Vibrio parahaemolyticus]HCG7050890.1 class I SAM-dependent methyltransferase [Vibrio parahaemolyticus]HCG7542438.1 class I SAM-dependent methyltransferase [Vibrio parahaemolyticus]HCH0356715.1 class I SAM-dependent methyltransferase [Vibrio parahaemolyticus]